MGVLMKISCCIIGKNEVNDIDRCIKSIIDKVYEVIYVDTGSSDGTLDYVKTNFPTVKTYFYKWNDNFALARNYSLSKAKGDYILYLDCDEEFVGNFPTTLDKAVFNIEINNKTDSGNYIKTIAPRLIFKEKGLKFINAIHERFDTNLPIKNFKEGFIIHYGYLKEYVESKNKIARNIASLEKELENNPDSTNFYYLGQEFLAAKEYEKALYLAKNGIEKLTSSSIHITFKPLLYELFLSACISLKDEEQILEFENLMLKDSNNPECYMLMLRWYIEKANDEKIFKYIFNTVKWVNAEKVPVKLLEKNILFMPFILAANYYLEKDTLLSLYFLELAVTRGLRDKRVIQDIIDLMPKSERNISKFNYYETLLENTT